METSMYVSRKLEKIIKKFISNDVSQEENLLGMWNAHVFYVSRKKCWMIIHKTTRYVVVIADVKQIDVKNFTTVFTETLYSQLVYEEIRVDYSKLQTLIGEIKLNKTDNDRSANGSINNRIQDFEYWIYEFGHFNNMPFRDLNGRLNNQVIEMFKWKKPKEMMAELLNALI